MLQVEVLYGDEPLKDYYTLMDIAYFYEWRRVSETFHVFDFETQTSAARFEMRRVQNVFIYFIF